MALFWDHGGGTTTGVAFDGRIMTAELYYEGDEEESYDLYHSPILLNGREYTLEFCYDYADEQFYILGARRGIDTEGIGAKELRRLRSGDEISLLTYESHRDDADDDSAELVTMDTFAYQQNMTIDWGTLGDGGYVFSFEMVDAQEHSMYSNNVLFTIEDGDIALDIED